LEKIETIMKKHIPFILVILFLCFEMALLIFIPSVSELKRIDPNQIGFLGLLQNPIIQLLFCLSLFLMLVGFVFVIYSPHNQGLSLPKNTTLLYGAMVVLSSVAVIILLVNWAYIHAEFTTLISTLFYEAYNPQAEPSLSYYQWTYSLNPAKTIVGLLLLPLFLPLFYFLRKKTRNKKHSR
jgi:hypothetical protein